MIEVGSRRLVTPDGQPLERVHGIETEYGIAAAGLHANANNQYFANAVANLALKPFNNNYFNDNQAREYLDVGMHPEHSHAEDIHFDLSSMRVIAGHLSIAKRIEQAYQVAMKYEFRNLAEIGRHPTFYLLANTCNQAGGTWSSHENFLVPRAVPQEAYVPAFTAHRLSRIVWSGAGLPRVGPNGRLRYDLSEKAPFIFKDIGTQSTHSRPLYNTRDEPLADANRFRRIHDVSGETVFSPFVNALRQASNDIVAAGVETGATYDDLLPIEPVRAMREISTDSGLKRRVRVLGGKAMTGLEIQREIAERSLAAITKAGYLTPQRLVWGQRWLELLDDLEADPMSRPLDWVVKKIYIDKKLSRPLPAGKSEFDVAWDASLFYHRILPEGLGMTLLKEGRFEDSPGPEFWAHGLPLPMTRARLRAEICAFIRQFKDRGIVPVVTLEWSGVAARDILDYIKLAEVRLPDPYQTEAGRNVLAFYERVTSAARSLPPLRQAA